MITYTEESDYGQAVQQLMGEIAELMDTEKEYSKKEILSHLNKIKNWSYNLKRDVIAIPADDSFWRDKE